METGNDKKRPLTVHIVVGVMQTGSGTLTYPEDFDIDGVFAERSDAEERCKALNKHLIEDGVVDEDGDYVGDAGEEDMYYSVESRTIV